MDSCTYFNLLVIPSWPFPPGCLVSPCLASLWRSLIRIWNGQVKSTRISKFNLWIDVRIQSRCLSLNNKLCDSLGCLPFRNHRDHLNIAAQTNWKTSVTRLHLPTNFKPCELSAALYHSHHNKELSFMWLALRSTRSYWLIALVSKSSRNKFHI